MALYQSRKNIWDAINGLDIPPGIYIETDCVKWVARLGKNLRKLDVNEKPISGLMVKQVSFTVEDSIVVEPEKAPIVRKTLLPVDEVKTDNVEVVAVPNGI